MPEPINVWSYLAEYEELREQILEAVDDVFSSGRLILGEQVRKFEADFAAYLGGPHPGVGVNSGTDALFIALKSLGISDGDEVITVANTAVPTVAAIVSAGGRPVFVDIDPDTYLMRPDQLENVIGPRTRCILPVHLYGQCAEMEEIGRIAEKHGLSVLEDCAQGTGATRNGRMAGMFGDAAAFSFYPTKPLGAYGDGGMIVTTRQETADKARRLRMYGMAGEYYAEEHGYNSRLDEVQAAILNLKLAHLDGWNEKRRALAARYRRNLDGSELVLPAEAPGNWHVYYIYVVRHPERDRLLAELKKIDINLNISYPYPISSMRGYDKMEFDETRLPATLALAEEIFSLPMYPHLENGDVDRVCAALLKLTA